MDQRVCITRWGRYDDEYDVWTRSTWTDGAESGPTVCVNVLLSLSLIISVADARRLVSILSCDLVI